MFMVIFLSIALPSILILMNNMIFMKDMMSREKFSPFECGFDPINLARLPFSIRFYLIAVIFLIFDIEITLIMPLPYIFSMNNILPWIFMTMMFLMILLVGLYHEWNQGALKWAS